MTDLTPSNHERVDMLVCSMPRSGGNLLLRLLADAGGPPCGEWPARLPEGARVALVHLHYVEQVSPPQQAVYLFRRNLLAQAVSWAVAYRTGQWYGGRSPAVELDPGVVSGLLGQLLVAQRSWIEWLASRRVEVFPVAYEDLIGPDPMYARCAVEVLGGDPALVPEMPDGRQASWVNDVWVDALEVQVADLVDVDDLRGRVERMGAANGYVDINGNRLDGLVRP